MALVAQYRFQTLSPIKLDHVEAHAIARPDEPDHLDIEVGLRSRQRQREKELAEGCYRDSGLHFALQLQALTMDDGSRVNASIRLPGQIAVSLAAVRSRFRDEPDICGVALFDLVA